MSIMKVGLVAAGSVLALTLPLAAQTPAERPPVRRLGGSPIGIEEALRLRQELELSSEQVSRLETLRRERVEAQGARTRELLDLRSRLRAGDITGDEFQRQMQTGREALRARAAERANPVAEILTDAQRQKAGELRRDMMRREVRWGMRQRGWQGRGGFGPRMRVPVRRFPGARGFGPGMGPRFRR